MKYKTIFFYKKSGGNMKYNFKLSRKNVFITIAIMLMGLVFATCSAGLGEAIDTDAPEINITKPLENNSFVPKTVRIEGTAKDGHLVKSVEVEYEYSYFDETEREVKTIKQKRNAVLENKGKDVKWYFQEEFDKDYEVKFNFVAKDDFNNSSIKSSQSIGVLIDSNPPELGSIGIRRNNNTFVARLIPLSDIKNKVKNSAASESNDYIQNENFTIFARLSDEYGMSETTMDLYEVNPETGAETLIIENKPNEPTDSNLFNPTFLFTSQTFASIPSLSSGVHYLKPVLKYTDKAGQKKEANKNGENGYLAWWEEFDYPRIYSANFDEQGEIHIQKKSTIQLNLMDDDGLDSYKYVLIDENEWEAALRTSGGDVKNAILSKESSMSSVTVTNANRDDILTIDSSKTENGGIKELLVIARDKRIDMAGRESKIVYKAVKTVITDNDSSIIVVSSPLENSTPMLENKKFTISGYTVDNESVSNFAIAWCPEGNTQVSRAQTILEGFSYDSSYIDTPFVDTTTGIRVWTIRLGAPESYSTNKKKNDLSKTFDVSTDFVDKNGVSHPKDRKVFVMCAKDNSNNNTVKIFRLNEFSAEPTFEISTSTSESGPWRVRTESLLSLPVENVYVKVEPKGENGLGITSYSSTCSDGPAAMRSLFTKDGLDAGKTYKIYHITSPEQNSRCNVLFNTTDEFENNAKQKLTFVFEEQAVLSEINCSMADNIVLLEGRALKIQANFTAKVTVDTTTNKPYIQLSGDDGNGNAFDGKAVYKRGSGTSSLYFEYDVPKNVKCVRVASPVTNPISDPDNAISRYGISLTPYASIASKNISIDSIPIQIVSQTVSDGGKITKINNAVSLSWTFNKELIIETGNVVVERFEKDSEGNPVPWSIPVVLSKDVFWKLYYSATDAQKIALIGSANGHPKFAAGTIVPEGPYREYTQGIVEKNGKMMPNLTTQYVLAYDIDIEGISEKTAALREVLEALGYHRKVYDVHSSSISLSDDKKTLTLTVSGEDFVDGLKDGAGYKLTFSRNAFRDDAGNIFEGEITQTFSTDKVSKPVIRVNRFSSNGGNTKPAAQVYIRIDCETPGATIYWGHHDLTANEVKDATGSNKAVHTTIADLTVEAFNAETFTYTTQYTQAVKVGVDSTNDQHLTKAEKIYLKAVAKKDGFTDSDLEKEGAFKTAWHAEQPRNNNSGPMHVYGCEAPEGASFTSGFPLKQNGDDAATYKVAYKTTPSGKNNYWWLTWEILNDFTNQVTLGGSYQNPADTGCTFGEFLYTYKKQHY